jgi:hypothetical protein
MSKREKILASAVGAVLLILGLQYGYSTYRDAINTRQRQVFNLTDQVIDRQTRQLEGAQAQARMGEFIDRSLPGDLTKAQSMYNQFLSDLVTEVGLSSVATKPTGSISSPGLYTQLNFNVVGSGDLEQMIDLLYRFHKTNYLHRIQSFSLSKARGKLTINMDVQAISLNDALPDAQPQVAAAPRVNPDPEFYRLPILNRNPISPPNQQPKYAAETSPKAIVGQMMNYSARFNDPDEGQELTYSFAEPAPEGVRLDPRSGTITLNPDQVGEIELTVAASDNGWPRLSAQQRIVFNVVPPPPAPEPEPEKPKFDEATQTFLTGLTQSKGRWMAMLHVRTRGETLKLVEGDTFEIGQLKGTVVEVTQRFAVLETEGERFVLSFDTSLADAKTNADP